MAVVEPAREWARPMEAARMRLAQLPPGTSLESAFGLACELAAKALEVERVGVWLFVEDGAALRCAVLYEASKDERSSGAVLRIADFPNYFRSVAIRKSVPAEVATNDPRTAELAAAYLTPLGITSMLDAGIFVEGKLVGVVCHEHVGSMREWTTEARDFAGSIADLLAMRIQAAAADELRAAFRTQGERLAALEKSAALEKMAAGIAHDFKNLLAAIVGNADLLRTRIDLPVDARQQADEIVAAAESGVALVRDLLDFANPIGKPPAVLDLAEATAAFLPVLRSAVGKRHDVRYGQPDAVGKVLLERTQFQRVLMNLVVNARDAMPDGGTIELRVRPVKLTGGLGMAGHFVMLEVCDRGAGMDESTRRRAFEPFFTTHANGNGMGLAIVHRIVDRAGGQVRVESDPAGGTIMRVFFPRVGASSGQTTEMAVPPSLLAAYRESMSKS